MGKECGAWVSRRLWGGGNTSPLKTTAWEANVYHDILKPGLILGPKGAPAAQETIFGWVLFGEVTTLHATTSLPSYEETLEKFWTLEEPPKARLLLPLDKQVVQDFNQRHKRDETGRFVVRLPFEPQSSSLGES